MKASPFLRGSNRNRLSLSFVCFIPIYFYRVIYTYRVATSEPFFSPDKENGEKIASTISLSYAREINENITQSSSACLLVSDDNHFLIEWIAYHYHVVNLRHLIVTSDPNSRTSPNNILNRWNDKMMIEIWNDTHIFKDKKFDFVYDENNNAHVLRMHRLRQSIFNTKCLRSFKSQNKSWVMLSDTDEFVTINPSFIDQHQEEQKYSIQQPGSVMAFLVNLTMPTPSLRFDTPCLPIYRRQFTAIESQAEEVALHVPSNFDGSDFATLRWRKWGSKRSKIQMATGKNCSFDRIAGPSKVIIDLARLKYQDLLRENVQNIISGNPHAPIESCSADNKWIKAEDVGLIIHHYLGTREQWTYRSADSRGNAYRIARYNMMKSASGVKESVTGRLWLKGFVESVGENDAFSLLKGVGKLDPLPMDNKPNDTLSNYELESETYRSGDLVQVYWKKKNGWYWSQVRETNKYANKHSYNVVILQKCTELIAVSHDKIRRNGSASGTNYSHLSAKPIIHYEE